MKWRGWVGLALMLVGFTMIMMMFLRNAGTPVLAGLITALGIGMIWFDGIREGKGQLLRKRDLEAGEIYHVVHRLELRLAGGDALNYIVMLEHRNGTQQWFDFDENPPEWFKAMKDQGGLRYFQRIGNVPPLPL